MTHQVLLTTQGGSIFQLTLPNFKLNALRDWAVPTVPTDDTGHCTHRQVPDSALKLLLDLARLHKFIEGRLSSYPQCEVIPAGDLLAAKHSASPSETRGPSMAAAEPTQGWHSPSWTRSWGVPSSSSSSPRRLRPAAANASRPNLALSQGARTLTSLPQHGQSVWFLSQRLLQQRQGRENQLPRESRRTQRQQQWQLRLFRRQALLQVRRPLIRRRFRRSFLQWQRRLQKSLLSSGQLSFNHHAYFVFRRYRIVKKIFLKLF